MPDSPRHYFKELRLQQFRGLVALSRWHTFSAAAAALKLTRASVWQQVRALEKELSCTLLRTRGHRVEFTAAGEKLVEIVAPLVAGFDSIKSTFLSGQGELPQTLVIAAAPIFLVNELNEPISRIHALYPKLHLTFLERNSPVAIELLEQGSADLAIAVHPAHLPMRPALEYTPLNAYPFTLICQPQHPLLKKKQLTLRDLSRQPLILPSNATYCRQHFDMLIGQAGLQAKLNIVLESNFPAMLFEYVRIGLGVALVPLPPDLFLPKRLHQSGVALRNAADIFGAEQTFYVRRKGEFETLYARKFRDLVVSGAAARQKNQGIPIQAPTF